ncbi:ribonuclease H-like domain-containing protein [Suillus paluster]|uniref:ribonuclease H-like domain-containing protein n=1 Tax=Suillus paluster TaxID=48578 RepID=UPI001B862A01|nr:ribonuclease H-like domain-containing protein [Suillus paluster]KAG1727642.1 ribonuclease H-like domain-containing protein [Suillus paluster]
MAKISKRSKSNRGWWWDHFVEHPGYAVKDPASMVSRKAKVVCARLYEQRVAHEQAIDEQQVHAGQRDAPRDEVVIAGTFWASGQNDPQRTWLISRPTTLLCHLRDCTLHSEDIRSQAWLEYHQSYSLRKGATRVLTPAHLSAIPPIILATSPPDLNISSTIQSARPSFPALLIPEADTALSSSSSLYRDSLLVSPSPALLEISLPSHPKRQHLIQSGQYHSASGSLPPLSPIALGNQLNGFGDQAWTTSDQADWEIRLARLTTSAGLPLRWVENHKWKVLCDHFLPRAKIPSAKVLTQRVLPHALNILKGTAKEECQGADATLQCDSWTGENHHHLLGFMMTAHRKLHMIKVHDASMDPHTAEELLKQMLDAISRIESEWGATRCLLQEQLPHIVVPNCLAHQWNLIVSDLFKVKDDYGIYGDMAQELITWLCSKTCVLTSLHEIQMATIGKMLTVLRAVLTHWMSHYLAYRRLLELRPALELLVTKHEAHLISGGDARSRRKTQTAIATIKNATFWHALARWKTLLEPISLMMNVHQARPENVAISFGFLHFCYSKIDNSTDLAARTAVLASVERRWEQCDQEVFIAAIIVNPFYKVSPFRNVPLTMHAGLATLFAHLWRRFYNTNDIPLNLYMDLDDYLNSSHDFAYMDNYKLSLLYHAEKEGVSVDPIDIWTGLSHPGSARRPLHTITQRLLSICPNSTSCEHPFSMFGAILTKWRNRLSTEMLTLLAELKMYVHEEHVRNDVVKKQLQCRYCDTEDTDKAEPTQVVHAVGDDLSGESSEREPRSLAFERRGISDVAADLIRAVQEEEEISATESMHSVPVGAVGGSFSHIAINDLLDYSRAEEWLGSFYKVAI